MIPQNFNALVQAIHIMLTGMRLPSITGRSDITLHSIDLLSGDIRLTSSAGKPATIRGAKLNQLWQVLQAQPAVHVESLLRGGGPSRSHMETIMANLPFVEHLHINGLKHISLSHAHTHAAGVLKQMDQATAQVIRGQMP